MKSLDNKTFELIACLPRIAVALANKEKAKDNSNLEQVWHILSEMFEKWLAGKSNEEAMKGGEPYFMSWNALMEQPALPGLIWILPQARPKAGESNIFNKAARDSLAKYLCKKGMMKKVEEEVPFDFIGTRQNWKNWEEDYHTLYPESGVVEPELDYLTITLGAFTLRALAKGHVKWKEGNIFTVHVDEIAVILWDSFNFHDDKKTLEYYAHKIIGLGDWR